MKYGVPLLINDRIDVHLAVGKFASTEPIKLIGERVQGASGIHIGQSDCPLLDARRLLGPNAIIGVSVGKASEARQAITDGADYVGIGPVWHTTSKDLKGKRGLGPNGVGKILEVLSGTGVKAVAIGTYTPKHSSADVRRNTFAQPSATAPCFDLNSFTEFP